MRTLARPLEGRLFSAIEHGSDRIEQFHGLDRGPGTSKRLMLLVDTKSLKQLLTQLCLGRGRKLSQYLLLQRCGVIKPSGLGERHACHDSKVQRLLRGGRECLQQRKRSLPVANGSIRRGGEDAREGQGESGAIGKHLHPLRQLIARVRKPADIDQRHRVSEPGVGDPRIELEYLAVVCE